MEKYFAYLRQQPVKRVCYATNSLYLQKTGDFIRSKDTMMFPGAFYLTNRKVLALGESRVRVPYIRASEQARHALLSLGQEEGEGGNARRCCRYTTRISGRREGGAASLLRLFIGRILGYVLASSSHAHTPKKRGRESSHFFSFGLGASRSQKSQLSLEYASCS